MHSVFFVWCVCLYADCCACVHELETNQSWFPARLPFPLSLIRGGVIYLADSEVKGCGHRHQRLYSCCCMMLFLKHTHTHTQSICLEAERGGGGEKQTDWHTDWLCVCVCVFYICAQCGLCIMYQLMCRLLYMYAWIGDCLQDHPLHHCWYGVERSTLQTVKWRAVVNDTGDRIPGVAWHCSSNKRSFCSCLIAVSEVVWLAST